MIFDKDLKTPEIIVTEVEISDENVLSQIETYERQTINIHESGYPDWINA